MRLKSYNSGAALMLKSSDLAIFDYKTVREGRMDMKRHIISEDGTSELADYFMVLENPDEGSDFKHSTPSHAPNLLSTMAKIFERLGSVTAEINSLAGEYDPWKYDRPPFMSVRFWHMGERFGSSYKCDAFYNDLKIPSCLASEHRSLLLEAWRLTPLEAPTKS